MKDIVLGVSLLLVGANLIFAQSESGRAILEGSVSDATKKVIAGASIAIRETQTGLGRETQTDADGQFRAAALPVGTYTVEAAAPGFGASRIENLTLTVGETKSLTITLQVASLSTEVSVIADIQVVNLTDASNSISINSRAIEDLPIRGRNFTEFAQLSPRAHAVGSFR